MGRRHCIQAHGHQFALLRVENHTILPALSDVRSVLPKANYFRRGMRACVAKEGLISSVLSLYVNDIPVPSLHAELALKADNTTVIATSRKTALFVSYLESFLAALELCLRNWRITINVSKSMAMLFTCWRIQTPRSVVLFGEPIVWVDKTHYLEVTHDKRVKGTMPLRGWVCWALSWAGEVAF